MKNAGINHPLLILNNMLQQFYYDLKGWDHLKGSPKS
jgi:hypothetical protein